jgi:NAD-dependent dihydropyrimidine dehydrogenase PreA subunit
MQNLRYLENVVTLTIDAEACVGCGMCLEVCPQGVLARDGEKVAIVDRDGCMECGACALNCPVQALAVTPGVGCASYIIKSWIKGKENAACGGSACC